MIPEGFITELLARTDIVDVIGRYVKLQKKGVNWMACCPFHKEKTPSFAVNQSKQFYKCFGCGKSGSVIGFLMDYKGLSFPEAVKELAESVGMQVPQSPKSAAQERKRLSFYELNARAADYYAGKLSLSDQARQYLAGRGISQETIEKFWLGYSPNGWRSLQDVFPNHYQSKDLIDCGLVLQKDSSRYDRFRGRVMYPIRNPKGQVIGFGARTMVPGEEPKYLNSPETPIYHKGYELYGLYEARDQIRKKGRAIVCEGYMDVIQMSQGGFGETVAALGTSITSEHVKKLFQLTDAVYFSFDGDDAGFKAARRALTSALSIIKDTQRAYFLILPLGEDPDSIVKAGGQDAFEVQIKKAFPISKFFARDVIREVTGDGVIREPEQKAACIAIAKPLLQSMAAQAMRQVIIEEFAAALAVPPEEVASLCGVPLTVSRQTLQKDCRSYGRDAAQSGRAGRPVRAISAGSTSNTLVRRLLQCLLVNPSWFFAYRNQITDLFSDQSANYGALIFAIMKKIASTEDEGCGGRFSVGQLLALLRDDTNYSAVMRLIDEESEMKTPEETARKEVEAAFASIELDEIKGAIRQMLANGASAQALSNLVARKKRLQQNLQELKSSSVEKIFTDMG